MKALVTGGTGFIGSHLVDALLAEGHEVRCMVRNMANPQWIHGKPVEFIHGTLDSLVALEKGMDGVDVVFHVAGVTAARSRKDFFHGNVEGTRNALEAALKSTSLKRFVHVSSQTAVGPSKKDNPVNETSPCYPITTYGESKKAAEDVVKEYAGRLPVTVVRPPAVYGPRDPGIYSFFKTINNGLMPLIGFGEKQVSLVHVRDLVQGIILAGTVDGAVDEIFFIASDKFYTWPEVGAVTKQVMKKRAIQLNVPHGVIHVAAAFSQFLGRFQEKPPIFDREKGKDVVQGYWTCDIKKAKEILNYRQRVELLEGITETVEWYRANGWL